MKKLLLAVAFTIVALPAQATDWSQQINDMDDKPIMMEGSPLTLGRAASTALFGIYPDEKDVSAEDKFRRGTLALKLRGGGESILSVEELALVKKLVGKAYGPLIVTRALPMLDPGVSVNTVKTEVVPAPDKGDKK